MTESEMINDMKKEILKIQVDMEQEGTFKSLKDELKVQR